MTLAKGCVPTSSSCILWNGPKIECIDHCQGETIEDILYRLSEIVCQLQTDGCNCEPSLENMNCVLRDGQVLSFDLFTYLTCLFTDYCESLQGTPTGIETVNNKTIAIEEELASLLEDENIEFNVIHKKRPENVENLVFSIIRKFFNFLKANNLWTVYTEFQKAKGKPNE